MGQSTTPFLPSLEVRGVVGYRMRVTVLTFGHILTFWSLDGSVKILKNTVFFLGASGLWTDKVKSEKRF